MTAFLIVQKSLQCNSGFKSNKRPTSKSTENTKPRRMLRSTSHTHHICLDTWWSLDQYNIGPEWGIIRIEWPFSGCSGGPWGASLSQIMPPNHIVMMEKKLSGESIVSVSLDNLCISDSMISPKATTHVTYIHTQWSDSTNKVHLRHMICSCYSAQ